jgi:hypothetical protein
MRRFLPLLFLSALCLVPGGALGAGRLKLLGGPAWGRYASNWGMTNVWKPGYLIGVGFETGGGVVGLEVDVAYMLKGNSYNSRGWDYELGVISVPCLAKIKPFAGRGLFLLAGGELAYILSHTQKPGPFNEESYDVLFNTRRLDYGLVLGAGYGIDVGGATLEASGRYHHGLAKIFGLGYGSESYDLQTRALAVALGLSF